MFLNTTHRENTDINIVHVAECIQLYSIDIDNKSNFISISNRITSINVNV